MQLLVNTLHGRTITVNVTENDTIETVKSRIQDVESILIQHQRLIYAGKQLQNDKKLKHYKITNLSLLNLTPSLAQYKSLIKLHFDVSEIIPFIPFDLDPGYSIDCHPAVTIENALKELKIIDIIEYIEPFEIYIKGNDDAYSKSDIYTSKIIYSSGKLNDGDEIIFKMNSSKHSLLPKDLDLKRECIKTISKQWENKQTIKRDDCGSVFRECTETEFKAIEEIAKIIPTLKFNDELLEDILECLLNFTKYGKPESFENDRLSKSLIPPLLLVLSYENENNDISLNEIHVMVTQCIINLTAFGPDAGTVSQLFILANILELLAHFTDLCYDDAVLQNITAIYAVLSPYQSITQYHGKDKLDKSKGMKWQILIPLQIFLFHEGCIKRAHLGKDIVANIALAFNELIRTNGDEIDTILDTNYKMVERGYHQKQNQQRVLFDGFLRINIGDIEYFPNDISLLMFKYFNLYTCNKFDILQRLMDLMSQNEELEWKNRGLNCITCITRHCNHAMAVRLIKEFQMLDILEVMLKQEDLIWQMEDFVNVYWAISNLAYETFYLVWHSEIIKSIIAAFHKAILKEKYQCGSVIGPLWSMIQRVDIVHGNLECMVIEYELIKVLLMFIKMMLDYQRDAFPFEEGATVMKAVMQMIHIFLVDEDVTELTVDVIKKNNGVKLLNDVKEQKFIFSDIGQEPAIIATNILNTYFESAASTANT